MHRHNDTRPRTHVIVNEDGADLSRDIVTREALPEFDGLRPYPRDYATGADYWAAEDRWQREQDALFAKMRRCVFAVDLPGAAAMRKRAA